MTIKKFSFILSIACLSFGLNACKSGGSNSNQLHDSHSSKTCLDWKGTYSGIVPCADCEGIETKLSLNEDNTYQISWKYMGKGDKAYTEKGTFVWNSTGGMITLENMDAKKCPTMYKVCENHLLQLDLKGNEITGELADNYILNKEQ